MLGGVVVFLSLHAMTGMPQTPRIWITYSLVFVPLAQLLAIATRSTRAAANAVTESIAVAGLAAAFVLFRLFDITKWGPVGWADRRHGSFAIMADDVIAGLIAAALLLLIGAIRPQWLM